MKFVCFLAILASLSVVKSIYVNVQGNNGQGWANGPADNGPGAAINFPAGQGGANFPQGGAQGAGNFPQGGAQGANNFPQGGAQGANNFPQGGAQGANNFPQGGAQGSAPSGEFQYSNSPQGWNVAQFGGIPSLDWPANWPRAQVKNQLADGAPAQGGIGGPNYNANAGPNGANNAQGGKGPYDYLFDAAYNGALINLGIPAWYNPAFDNPSSNGVPQSYGLNNAGQPAFGNINNNAGQGPAGSININFQGGAQGAAGNQGAQGAQGAYIIYRSRNGRFWRRRGDGKYEGWRGANAPSANDSNSSFWVIIVNAANANDGSAPSAWAEWNFIGNANIANNNQGANNNNQFPAGANGQINWSVNAPAGQLLGANGAPAIFNVGAAK